MIIYRARLLEYTDFTQDILPHGKHFDSFCSILSAGDGASVEVAKEGDDCGSTVLTEVETNWFVQTVKQPLAEVTTTTSQQ